MFSSFVCISSPELSSVDPPSSELVTIDDCCPLILRFFDAFRLRFRVDDGNGPLLRTVVVVVAVDNVSVSRFGVGGSSGNFAYLFSNIC